MIEVIIHDSPYDLHLVKVWVVNKTGMQNLVMKVADEGSSIFWENAPEGVTIPATFTITRPIASALLKALLEFEIETGTPRVLQDGTNDKTAGQHEHLLPAHTDLVPRADFEHERARADKLIEVLIGMSTLRDE